MTEWVCHRDYGNRRIIMADNTRADLIDSLVDELLASKYLDDTTKELIGGLRVGAKEDFKKMPPEQQQLVTETFMPTSMLSGDDLPEEGIISSMMLGGQYKPEDKKPVQPGQDFIPEVRAPNEKRDPEEDFGYPERPNRTEVPDIEAILRSLGFGKYAEENAKESMRRRPSIYGE